VRYVPGNHHGWRIAVDAAGHDRLWSLYMRRRENHRTGFLSADAKE
jgi:predicted secreted protein